MLPPGASFNASWFVDENLVPLLDKFFAGGWDREQRKFVVHLDNAAAHNAKMTQGVFEYSPLKYLPQLPDSPDISPSDFCPFEKVKNTMIGQGILDEIWLLKIVIDILDRISGHEFQPVFRS
jgi:hypothetical protein